MAALCAGGAAESGNTTASAGQTVSHGLGQSALVGACGARCVSRVAKHVASTARAESIQSEGKDTGGDQKRRARHGGGGIDGWGGACWMPAGREVKKSVCVDSSTGPN